MSFVPCSAGKFPGTHLNAPVCYLFCEDCPDTRMYPPTPARQNEELPSPHSPCPAVLKVFLGPPPFWPHGLGLGSSCFYHQSSLASTTVQYSRSSIILGGTKVRDDFVSVQILVYWWVKTGFCSIPFYMNQQSGVCIDASLIQSHSVVSGRNKEPGVKRIGLYSLLRQQFNRQDEMGNIPNISVLLWKMGNDHVFPAYFNGPVWRSNTFSTLGSA